MKNLFKKTVIFALAGLLMFPVTVAAVPQAEEIAAPSAILVEAQSGRILYEKDADRRLAIASVTKVMTLNLIFEAMENGSLAKDEMIPVSAEAAGMGGSQAFLDAGYDYPAGELIKSIIVGSANDAAVAMAERVAGSETGFVAKMNQKAQQLGMKDTTFKNCTGLPAEGHLSTARDVSLMSRELLKHKDYFTWSSIWMDEIVHPKDGRKTELVNTNKLIRSLSGCDGLKTGYTAQAKFCVTATAQRDDMRLVAVVLSGQTGNERFRDAATLINSGFAEFENRSVIREGETAAQIPLKGGKKETAAAVAAKGVTLCLRVDGSEEIQTNIVVPEALEAPLQRGTVVGKLEVIQNGQVIETVDLVLQEDHAKATLWDRIKSIFQKKNTD